MTRIRHLLNAQNDLDADIVKQLDKKHIKSVADLWRAVGIDFDAGLEKVSGDTGVDRGDLIVILAEGARPRDSKVSRREVLLALAILALIVLFLWRLTAIWLPSSSHVAQVSVEHVVIVTDLPAFHIIEDGDVKLSDKPTEAEGFQKIDDVLGHYLVQPLSSGQVIEKDQLSTARLSASDLADRVILSIRLEPEALNPNITQGSYATLLLSPRDATEAEQLTPVEVDAIVLKIDELEDKIVLTVAIEEGRKDELGAMLGTSDLFILQSVP
jgi:hypothetical protein